MISEDTFLMIDLPVLLTAIFAATTCTLVGNLLVLRRQALLGDALSHMVLPGIVVAFLLTGDIHPLTMMAGALGAGLFGAAMIEALRRFGGQDSGTVMGIVFTAMFAAGVLLLEVSGAGDVHLDTEHALFGNMEGILWLGPQSLGDLADPRIWLTLPRETATLIATSAALAGLFLLFFKELRAATFDPDFAAGLGLRPHLVSAGITAAATVAAVAAFEAVGSILVVAMFTLPAAIARLATNRLAAQVGLSLAAAIAIAIAGYGAAAFGPGLFGDANALNAAGMIAVVGGLALAVTAVLTARRSR